MENEIYKTPEADLGAEVVVTQSDFYVVSPRKFLILFFITLGMYRLYWFYQNWALHKRINPEVWPIPRAIFSLFFTHSLFNLIDFRLKDREIVHSWSPGSLATVYVCLLLVEAVVERLSTNNIGSPLTDIISIGILPVLVWPLYQAQRAANAACGDPDGESNSRLTWANWLWIIAGMAFWLFVGIGMYHIVLG